MSVHVSLTHVHEYFICHVPHRHPKFASMQGYALARHPKRPIL